MSIFAQTILSSPASREAIFTDKNGNETVCRVLLNDTPAEVRRENGEEYFSDNAELACSHDIPVIVGGKFTVEDSVYSVTNMAPSRAPGLVDCAVYRISGNGVEMFDLSGPIMNATHETLRIDGRYIDCVVSRRAETLEVGDDGYETVNQRNKVGIKLSDSAGIDEGSVVEMDGNKFRVLYTRRTSAGLITLVC